MSALEDANPQPILSHNEEVTLRSSGFGSRQSIHWPVDTDNDLILQEEIEKLKIRFSSEHSEFRNTGYNAYEWEKYRDYAEGLVRQYNARIAELEYESKKRIERITIVRFDKKTSTIFFQDKKCNIAPDSNQFYVCKILFERYPNGELVDYETIIELIGDDPEATDPKKVRNAALEINKKTKEIFGFPIFTTPRRQIAFVKDPNKTLTE